MKRPAALSASEEEETAGLEALTFGMNSEGVRLGGPGPHSPLSVAGSKATHLQSAWEDPADQAGQASLGSSPRLRKLRNAEDEVAVSTEAYQQRLRQQHGKLTAGASWTAQQQNSRAEYAPQDVQVNIQHRGVATVATRAGGLLAASRCLPSGQLEITRLRDANAQEPSKSVVSSLAFHPNGQLLLAAGLDRHLRFFHVDGANNPHVQSIFLEDMPVHHATLATGGTHVVATGRRKFFYVLDLETASVERVSGIFGRDERSLEACVASTASSVVAFLGRDGHMPLVSLSSRQEVGRLKMNGTARAGKFMRDGTQLVTTGGDGTLFVWDLRMQRCISCHLDEGSVGGTALACSPTSATLACASTSGVVNIYQYPDNRLADAAGAGIPKTTQPLPLLRSLPHLTTSVDSLAFNHDGQVLGMASRLKRDSLRLVHLPTMTAFANWPSARTPLHYVHSLAFSPSSEYLAVGNAKGRVLLYMLHHYLT